MSGHGPTRREQEILDRSEAGETPAMIAAGMGIKTESVVRTLNLLHVSGANPFDAMVRHGSELLREAILRHHPDLVPARFGGLA